MNIFESILEEFQHRRTPIRKLREIEEREPTVNEHKTIATSATGDFITDYVKYADVLEAPAEAHEAVAISLLAAVLNRRVYFMNGPIKLSLDLWVLLLSGSGGGRNTLVDLARPILEETNLSSLVRSVDWGSKVALQQDIAQNPVGLSLWAEFSVVLKKFNSQAFEGAKEWLTDRFDSWSIPDSLCYRITGKRSDTPPIVFSQAPRISLLATSSYDWFVGSLSEQDSTGGFVPRWIIVQLQEPTKLVPIPQKTDQTLIAPLAAQLHRASELEGEADLSLVLEMFKEWYGESKGRFLEQPNRALAVPFFQRLRSNILKLAIVFEVSLSGTLKVSPESMTRAIVAARKFEQTIFGLLPSGMSREGSEINKIAERVKAAGPEGLSQSDLTKAFQSMKAMDRYGRIKTLQEGSTIQQFFRTTPGRKAAIFVHQDFLDEHKRQFPDDVQIN